MKVCPKCGKLKPKSEFYADKRNSDGVREKCKACYSIASRENRLANYGRKRETDKRWELANPERMKELHKLWRENNVGRARKTSKLWRANNLDRSNETSKKWREDNPDKVEITRKRADLKRRNSVKGKLKITITSNIRYSLRNNSKAGRHWETLVGYTIDDLKRHLEKQFTDEMNWGNQGSYWHIDHKIPVAVFNFETPEDIDFKRCWALKNLQPLEAIENIKKSAKIDKPFQPSLLLRLSA